MLLLFFSQIISDNNTLTECNYLNEREGRKKLLYNLIEMIDFEFLYIKYDYCC